MPVVYTTLNEESSLRPSAITCRSSDRLSYKPHIRNSRVFKRYIDGAGSPLRLRCSARSARRGCPHSARMPAASIYRLKGAYIRITVVLRIIFEYFRIHTGILYIFLDILVKHCVVIVIKHCSSRQEQNITCFPLLFEFAAEIPERYKRRHYRLITENKPVSVDDRILIVMIDTQYVRTGTCRRGCAAAGCSRRLSYRFLPNRLC